jgi:hypothetical protein
LKADKSFLRARNQRFLRKFSHWEKSQILHCTRMDIGVLQPAALLSVRLPVDALQAADFE